MEDYIKQFDTFEDFLAAMDSPETDVKDGQSEQLKTKNAIRRAGIEITRRNVKGETLDARNKAMEKIGYEKRMEMAYEELHG